MNINHVYTIYMRKMPNYVLLRAFEAAARLESFTLAAKELHLTQSAISHQIKELEDYFGKPLFFRKNRKVEPTSEGRRLLESLSRIKVSTNTLRSFNNARNLPFNFSMKSCGDRKLGMGFPNSSFKNNLSGSLPGKPECNAESANLYM